MKNPLEIAIIGAGPAGLASALYLHRAGHSVSIYERFENAAPIGSGLMLQPTGLSVLDDLGLLAAIKARGQRIERLWGIDAKSGRTVLDVGYHTGPKKIKRYGLAVNRAALFDVLHEQVKAEAIALITGTEIKDVTTDADGILVNARRFDLVLDCSGARSQLLRFAGTRQTCVPKVLPYGALWATLDWSADNASFDPHTLTQRYDKARVMIGVLPMGRLTPNGKNTAAFFWSLKPETFAAVKAKGLQAWKAEVLDYWPECKVYTDQIHSFDDFTLARYGHHTLKPPIGERIAFVGDSAHSASPQLGQGANMALLDAKAISHALASHSDITTALKAYARSRRRHMRSFQALSWMFTPFYQSDSNVLAFIRDHIVSPLSNIPPAPWILSNMVSGTIIDPFRPIGLSETTWAESQWDEQ